MIRGLEQSEIVMAGFPAQRDGVYCLTEGGQETEIHYRHGHDLPEFAMYPLLDKPAAMSDLRSMYRRVLDAAARHGFIAMISGLDYRGSPDWGEKLGYSRAGLAEALEQPGAGVSRARTPSLHARPAPARRCAPRRRA